MSYCKAVDPETGVFCVRPRNHWPRIHRGHDIERDGWPEWSDDPTDRAETPAATELELVLQGLVREMTAEFAEDGRARVELARRCLQILGVQPLMNMVAT